MNAPIPEPSAKPFRIEWWVEPAEWAQAAQLRRANPPGSFYDVKGLARSYLLWGKVQFAHGDDVLFRPVRFAELDERDRAWSLDEGEPLPPPRDPDQETAFWLGWPLLSLARQLASILDGRFLAFAASGHVAWVHHPEGGPSIRCRTADDRIWIDSMFDPGHRLSVPAAEFFRGIRSFLGQLAASVAERVPGMLDWESLAHLRAYAPGVAFHHATAGPLTKPGAVADGATASGGHGRAPDAARPASVRPPIRRRTVQRDGAFRIDWWVDDAAWAMARRSVAANPPGSYYDVEYIAPHDLLHGLVRFGYRGQAIRPALPLLASQVGYYRYLARRGDRPLPELPEPPEWAQLPLIDLAVRLSEIVQRGAERTALAGGRAGAAGEARRSVGDLGRIREAEYIRLSLFDDLREVVPSRAFRAGAMTFLSEFAKAIAERVPALLDWETMAPLRPYIT